MKVRAFGVVASVLLSCSTALANNSCGDDTPWVSVFVSLRGPAVMEMAQVYSQPGGTSGLSVDVARKRLDELRAQHGQMGHKVRQLGGEVTANLMRLANVVQVRIPACRVGMLERIPEVERVEQVTRYWPSLFSAVSIVDAPHVWEHYAGTGKGINIGIIDSGIDYTHADFGGEGTVEAYENNNSVKIEEGTFPTAKVVGGWDFVGDSYGQTYRPSPDEDPLDCLDNSAQAAGGHGTHVAGIAAGFGVDLDGSTYRGTYEASLDPREFQVFPGVAPQAKLWALKVFGCKGGTDMVASAIEWAVDPNGDGDFSDRLDVVNLSLGGAYGVYSETEAQVVKNATQAGMFLVVAAGNDGNTFYSVGTPSIYPEIMSVAAAVDELEWLGMRVVSPSAIQGDIACVEGVFTPPLQQHGVVRGKLVATEPRDACNDIVNEAQVRGGIAYIERGDCYFVDKVQRAFRAGAIAVVVVNNEPHQQAFAMGGDAGSAQIPGVMISKEDGAKIEPHLNEGVQVVLDASNRIVKSDVADQVAFFSSRGPIAHDGTLKPDVAAPGHEIVSALVGSGHEGIQASGTSMACPMLSGAAAVVRQVFPQLPPWDVKALIMNTAAPMHNEQGDPVPVSLAGAGRVSVRDAVEHSVTAALKDNPAIVSLSFGTVVTSSHYSKTLAFEVKNHGKQRRSLSLSVEPSYEMTGAELKLSESLITLEAGQTKTVSATLVVEPDKLPEEVPDPHTPDKITVSTYEFDRYFVNEFAGVVRIDDEQTQVRLPFHAVVRAADERRATGGLTCSKGGPYEVMLPVGGNTTHKAPVVSVLELAKSHSRWPDDFEQDPTLDLIEVGVGTDLGKSVEWEDAYVYFGLAVAKSWTTPARGMWSLLGVSIDVNNDSRIDYVVYPEPLSRWYYADAMQAVVYASLGQERLGSTNINRFGPLDLNGEVFNNSVLVLPVKLSLLEGLSRDNPSFSFRAFTQGYGYGSIVDVTDWIAYDPANAWLDTTQNGYEHSPLFVGLDNEIRFHVTEQGLNEPGRSLLLLHHTNDLAMRVQKVSMAEIVRTHKTDLSVTQQVPDEMERGATGTWPVRVSNGSSGVALYVRLDVTMDRGAKVVRVESDDGQCSVRGCDWREIGAGKSVEARVTVEAGSDSFTSQAVVKSAGDCELNPADNEVASVVTVRGPGGDDAGLGDGGRVRGDYTIGGGCQCAMGGERLPGAFGWIFVAGLAVAVARRKRAAN